MSLKVAARFAQQLFASFAGNKRKQRGFNKIEVRQIRHNNSRPLDGRMTALSAAVE
jgi:hypothetical protein